MNGTRLLETLLQQEQLRKQFVIPMGDLEPFSQVQRIDRPSNQGWQQRHS